MSDASEKNDAEVINDLAHEFDNFCQARHNAGAAEYGETGFLKNNMFRMIAEELADGANYMRYLYIKIRLLEGIYDSENSINFASADALRPRHEVSHDTPSFVSAGNLSKLLGEQDGF